MWRKFSLEIDLFETRCGDIAWSEALVPVLLEIVASANERVIACGKIPILYHSGVRYIREAPDHERFQAIPAVLRAGGADCEDLCAWRVAELRYAGEPARFHITKHVAKNGALTYHIQVQRMVKTVSGGWAPGPIEDPSLALGMGSPAERQAAA